MADISVLEIDLITDDGLHHKSVLKVPNAVAIPCLTFNDAWKEGRKGERERSFSQFEKWITFTNTIESSHSLPLHSINVDTASYSNTIYAPIGSMLHQQCLHSPTVRRRHDYTTLPPPQCLILRSVLGVSHTLIMQEAPCGNPHTHTYSDTIIILRDLCEVAPPIQRKKLKYMSNLKRHKQTRLFWLNLEYVGGW